MVMAVTPGAYSRKEKDGEEKKMTEESRIKSALLRTFVALVLCMGLIVLKFVLKNEKIVEGLYNYLTTDIVFLVKMWYTIQ
ncbi:MAG: hypothetical protein J6A77_05420 [Lachnospiraceae bacterium]|nr:hypothetical protein [Lachnospiraceae bacterium]